jgi:flagellar biosynthesis/type III secretory pathway protein FliH
MRLNIDYGHNKELMTACRPLNDYALFVNVVRQVYKETKDMEAAFDCGITALEAGSHLKQFLLMRKAEVTDMFLTEYNEEETMNMFKEEAYEQGLEKGMEQGLEQGRETTQTEYRKALALFRQGASILDEFTSQGISEEVACDVLGIEK